ncbi:universal stress protein [Nocardioides sp. HDW12B]|uniref:universal stress protein n=1 Tax=Nocardioides sp. HDW12B TaxID=2714939 RepID=UPI001409CE57|nr:universal stress protein [Nocardioides sp. HDW12B]QIK67322.1 universal stress protein [Nocardioides sp. HDW12B]
MTFTPPRGAVVVGVDDSDASTRALEAAALEATASHRPLHVVHAWSAHPTGYAPGTYPHTAVGLSDALKEYAATVLTRAVTGVREAHPGLEVTEELAMGDARQVLETRSEEAAVLVVGSRGHGALKRMLLGSTSAWLARHAHSPLLVVRPSLDGEKRGVAVGTDGGHASANALAHAYAAASRRGTGLTVVTCYDPIPRHVNDGSPDLQPGEPEAVRRTMAEAVAGLAEKYPDVEVTLDAVASPAVDHLVELSDHVGLLVVGSHRRSRIGSLTHLSTSRVVVEHARCAVAVVPETEDRAAV